MKIDENIQAGEMVKIANKPKRCDGVANWNNQMNRYLGKIIEVEIVDLYDRTIRAKGWWFNQEDIVCKVVI